MQTVTVQVVSFPKGPKFARKFGGRYNPSSKTWDIPVTSSSDWLNAPGLYGLQVVTESAGCPHYDREQGCPMHGEYCANWGR